MPTMGEKPLPIGMCVKCRWTDMLRDGLCTSCFQKNEARQRGIMEEVTGRLETLIEKLEKEAGDGEGVCSRHKVNQQPEEETT